MPIPFGAAVGAAALAVNIAATNQDPEPDPITPPASQNKNYFNPQMAIVFDFRGRFIDPDASERKLDFSEIEFGFAADVDPYLKAEAYIAIAKEDGETIVEVEEAFGRYTNLGGGMEARVGKIAAAIGRIQRNHADQLNFLDYPFVIQDMLGEEGLRAPGVSLAKLLGGERFNEVSIEAHVPSEDGPLFTASDTGNPVWVGHYRTFLDFSEDLSAQLGASYANGPNGGTRGQMYGADFVAKWQPGMKGRSAIFESEAYWGTPGGGAETAFGTFASLSYELMPRTFVTGKFDYSEIPGSTDNRTGLSIGLTRKMTEFHHLRLEWQHISSNFESDRDLLTIQFQYLIGAHPAHKY